MRSRLIGEVPPWFPKWSFEGHALFGGDRARDLQIAGQQLGQASDSLFALYERKAQEANETRVQDLNNRFIGGMQDVLRTGPNAFSKLEGADAIQAAGAATETLKKMKADVFGQAVNGYQRNRLGPILDTHLASATEQIARHVDRQQEVYDRNVAAAAVKVAQREARSNPDNLAGAATRAGDFARLLVKGQAPEVVESESRKAVSQILSSVITDRLATNDPSAVGLYRQYRNRLEPADRLALGSAVETLLNTLDAAAWLRERSATLRPPAPTGDAALDAVNAGSASTAEPPAVVSSGGALLDPDGGIVGTRQRLADIEERHRALTALNRQEFAADPARLRANQAAIDTDTVRRGAAEKAEVDGLYADLRRHLTTGGPDGGPALTPPPATIMSRLTDAQQDAVTAQVKANIAGRKTVSDPQTRYAIRRGLTADDAGERQRWAATSLVPFMGRLSPEDYAELEKQQTVVRDDGAGQRRLQAVTRMADEALRSIGIDPAPRPDAAASRDAVQAAMFHRAVQDELSAFESKGGVPNEAEAYAIVDGLKNTGIKSGWLKVSAPTVMADFSSTDEAFHEGGAQLAQAEPDEQKPETMVRLAPDFETFRRQMEEARQREAAERAAAGTGGAGGAPATEPDPGSPEYRAADEQARRIVVEQAAEGSGGQGTAPATEPPPGSPEYQAAEKEARQIANRQEAGNREADRMITRWLAQQWNEGSVPKLPPVLAERLSPEERRELEALAVTPDTQTDPEVYNRILSNLLNYNSQVRLKWAHEPLFRYRKSLSGPDFTKLALLQNRLDPETGQVSGFAPVPADLAPLYDWLAPEPDWDYQTFTAIKGKGADKDWRFVLPTPVRSFLKGMLDLLAAEKTGELTTDALESFMTLHGAGGRAFGPIGGEGTFVAGGKKIYARVPKTPEQQFEKYQRKVKQLEVNQGNGRAFEQETAALRTQEGFDVGEQVTVMTPSGLRLRVDLLLRDRLTGEVSLEELKSSLSARLTKNQKAAYEEVSKYGGTIVGEGKPHFYGGLKLPASPYRVMRKLKSDE